MQNKKNKKKSKPTPTANNDNMSREKLLDLLTTTGAPGDDKPQKDLAGETLVGDD